MLKRYIRRGNPPPLIYLYSDTECVAVSGTVDESYSRKRKIKSK